MYQLTDQGNNALHALNCLITCSMGALQMGHGSPLCFKTCAQGQQQQQCPVSPWISVAFLGFSMQIIHLLLTSMSSGDATVFPFSVTKDGLASAADVGVKRSLVIQGFSSGLRLKLKPAAKLNRRIWMRWESRGISWISQQVEVSVMISTNITNLNHAWLIIAILAIMSYVLLAWLIS